MKAFPIMLAALVLMSAAVRAQDAHFEFHSPFSSDGTNQAGLDPRMRKALVFDHVWNAYLRAREDIFRSYPAPRPNEPKLDHTLRIFRLGQLLETMAELRAFMAQNKGYAVKTQEKEFVRVDQVLRSMNLSYDGLGGQGMVDYCAEVGADRVSGEVRPVLFGEDGKRRSIPPVQLGAILFPKQADAK